MSKKIQLTVPKPCDENWDNMNPVEKGRFCNSCEKQVVDFSEMSDRQIAEFFKKPTTGSVCGRFMTDQLDREIIIPKKRIPWFKYFFQIALPAFIFSIKGSTQALQGKVAVNRRDTIPQRPVMGIMAPCTKPVKPAGIVEIKVTDENGTPIQYASIITGVMGKGGVTDKNGIFRTDIAAMASNGKVTVSAGGYEKNDQPVVIMGEGKNPVIYAFVLKKSKLKLTNGLVGNVSGLNLNNAVGSDVRITLGQVSYVDPQYPWGSGGIVVNEKNEPLPGATIMLKGSSTGVAADMNGRFFMKIPANTPDATLSISYLGYESLEIPITIAEGRKAHTYILKEVKSLLTGAVVTVRRKTRKELKNIPLMSPHTENTEPAFKIFPNPIDAGTNLNIECKKTEEGYYTIEILNGSGQSVHHQEIWIDKDAKLLSIDIPEVPTGNYFIVLTNKKSKRSSSEKLIVQ
jgi:hypothetical protein